MKKKYYTKNSFENRTHREREEKEYLEKLTKKVQKILMDDEHYQETEQEMYEMHVDEISNQVHVIMWACVRVALKREGIIDRKANMIMALADTFMGQDMTMEEFRDWCIDETGMKINDINT